MMLIDAHAHLDLFDDAELDAALNQIEQHRILTLSNSMDIPSYERNKDIARECRFVLPFFGVHPWNAPDSVSRLEDLEGIIEESPLLGEIGLDHEFVADASRYPAQREVFEFFLAKAREQDKIVNLHTRGAEREILDLLSRYDIRRGIVHWYSGPMDVLHKLLDLGMHFTIGVEVLHSETIGAIAREVPEELLLTETDNPGGLKWLKDISGMPVVVRDVVARLASLRERDVEEMMLVIQANFERLIGDHPSLSEWYRKSLEQGGSSAPRIL
jgi:TatD DNase family protein